MFKAKHRAASVVLVVLMVVSAFFVSGFSAYAATNTDATASAGGTTVYFKNTDNWSSVSVHYWNATQHTTWPGEKMTLVSGTTNVYTYEIPAGYTSVIFNNSNAGSQTADLTMPSTSGQIYDFSTKAWSDYAGPTEPTTATQPTTATGPTQPTTATQPTTPSSEWVVYCQDEAGWGNVTAYMWNSSTDSNAGWPGAKMTDLGDNVWMYEMPKEFKSVIFSNSGSGQSSDLTLPGNGYIYNNKTGKWDIYDTSPVKITAFTTDSASPQYTGMDILVSATAKSSEGTVSYQFTAENTTTGTKTVISPYSSASSVTWAPNTVGSYTITVDVKDTAGNTNSRSMSYIINDPTSVVKPLINAITPANNGQIQKNSVATVNVKAAGGNTGTKLLFYKYVVIDPDNTQNTAYYTQSTSYQFTPTKLGNYKVSVYVQGSDNQYAYKTYNYSSVDHVDPTVTTPTTVPTQPTTVAPTTTPTQPTTVAPSTAPTTAVQYEIGDVNRDGVVNIRDATIVQLYLAATTKFDAEQLKLADANKDGIVDIRDASEIQMMAIG